MLKDTNLDAPLLFEYLRKKLDTASLPNSCHYIQRYGVRRQLRPLWIFTTDRRHARRTKKAAREQPVRVRPKIAIIQTASARGQIKEVHPANGQYCQRLEIKVTASAPSP